MPRLLSGMTIEKARGTSDEPDIASKKNKCSIFC